MELSGPYQSASARQHLAPRLLRMAEVVFALGVAFCTALAAVRLHALGIRPPVELVAAAVLEVVGALVIARRASAVTNGVCLIAGILAAWTIVAGVRGGPPLVAAAAPLGLMAKTTVGAFAIVWVSQIVALFAALAAWRSHRTERASLSTPPAPDDGLTEGGPPKLIP